MNSDKQYLGYKEFLVSHGIPKPESEFLGIPGRKYRFDFAWPDKKLALEINGGVYNRRAHGSISGILHDMEKARIAAVHGWRIIPVTPWHHSKSGRRGKVKPLDMDSVQTLEIIKEALK